MNWLLLVARNGIVKNYSNDLDNILTRVFVFEFALSQRTSKVCYKKFMLFKNIFPPPCINSTKQTFLFPFDKCDFYSIYFALYTDLQQSNPCFRFEHIEIETRTSRGNRNINFLCRRLNLCPTSGECSELHLTVWFDTTAQAHHIACIKPVKCHSPPRTIYRARGNFLLKFASACVGF